MFELYPKWSSRANLYTQVLLCAFSPWEWFCSTRTFSSSLETTLTIIALYYWPWQLTVENVPWIKAEAKADKTSTSVFPTTSSVMEYVYPCFWPHYLDTMLTSSQTARLPYSGCLSLRATAHEPPDLAPGAHANSHAARLILLQGALH
jgi:hypothetical protein